MSTFEYVLPLVSVVAGLVLTDLMTSLHRLLVARHRVRFDWIPLLLAAGVFLATLNWWWAFYGARDAAWLANYFMVAVEIVRLTLLYLAASIILPDALPDESEVHLMDYYWSQAVIFHGVMASYVFAIILFDALVESAALFSAVQIIRIAVFTVFSILALSRSRVVHAVGAMVQVATLIAFVVRFSVSI